MTVPGKLTLMAGDVARAVGDSFMFPSAISLLLCCDSLLFYGLVFSSSGSHFGAEGALASPTPPRCSSLFVAVLAGRDVKKWG